MFSHNKWYHIFVLPILIVINYALQINWTGFQIAKAIPILVLGIFSFSLAEYLIHRFIFHSERYLFDNRLVRYLHFVIHGIHHMLPIDPYNFFYLEIELSIPQPFSFSQWFWDTSLFFKLSDFQTHSITSFFGLGLALDT